MTDLERMARIFSALGNETRLGVMSRLGALGPGETLSVSALAEALEISRFAASHHLAILRSARLIEGERTGLTIGHHLNTETLLQIEDWYIPFIDAEQIPSTLRPA